MAVIPFELPLDVLDRVDNLLLDLGGVLYAIDPSAALRAFAALRPAGSEPLPPTALAHPVFQRIETGDTDAAGFRQTLRDEFGVDADDSAIDGAWNALLLGVIPGRVAALQALSTSHNLFLLSNTNPIHVAHLQLDAAELFACFEHLLFSCDMACRKPDSAIFVQAAGRLGIDPTRTLFVDDSEDNCRAAETEGYVVQHLPASTLT